MGRTRHGKIASLPHDVREEVNLRLLAGHEQRTILIWLATHEKVKAVLEEKFRSQPVSDQNLSDWKWHGHQEWLLCREATEMRRAAARFQMGFAQLELERRAQERLRNRSHLARVNKAKQA